MSNLTTPIKVIIADNVEIYARGIQHLLQQNPYFKVVGQFNSNDIMNPGKQQLQADVVILGISIPFTAAWRVLENVRKFSPKTAVVAMSEFHQDNLIATFMRKGARGCILRSATRNELYEAVRLASQGKPYFSPEIERRLCYYLANESKQTFNVSKIHELTEVDLQLIRLLCEGLTLKEIAAKWKTSLCSLQWRRKKIYAETSVHSLIELINYAVANAIYHPLDTEMKRA